MLTKARIIILVVTGIIYINDPANFTSTLSNLKDHVSESFNEGTDQDNEATKPPSTDEIEQLILKYTNKERQKHGLDPLEWDESLAEIAREHSQDMANKDFFAHTNLDGESPTDRAKRHDYPLHKELGGGVYSEGIAENISKMPTGQVEGRGFIDNDSDSIAWAIVDSWMNSEGHREVILNPDYDRLGVGVVYDGSTFYFSTQNFW